MNPLLGEFQKIKDSSLKVTNNPITDNTKNVLTITKTEKKPNTAELCQLLWVLL